MTRSRKRLSNLARSFGVGNALVVALWLATAIASPAQTFTTLVSFDGTNGAMPDAGLVQGRDGNFYGTTYGGGNVSCSDGCGTVFKITPAGTLNTIYSFCTQPMCGDGSNPTGLVLATDGNFYGTTYHGGNPSCTYDARGCGTVFKITPTDTLTTIYDFCSQTNCTDGAYPSAKLVQGTDGNFYGTSSEGGAGQCCGTIFKISPTGKLTTLRRFGIYNGNSPSALIQATDGYFYGTTSSGGGEGGGTVFKMTPKGKLTTLYRFCIYYRTCGGADPAAGLVQGTDGNFYGTTSWTSHCGQECGTVFKITPTGMLTTLFKGLSSHPYAALIQTTDGNFYGTTYDGGANGSGTLFQITPSGSLTRLYDFCSHSNYCADGSNPAAALVQGTDGNLYGTTAGGGGASNAGTVYRLSMGFGPFVAFVRDSGKIGATVEILGQGFTGTSDVSFNGTAAKFAVRSPTYLTATVPRGAATGYVTVTTPGRALRSNVVFRVTR
jgi:uncharacterized repeat protein (TIGR03803 family)